MQFYMLMSQESRPLQFLTARDSFGSIKHGNFRVEYFFATKYNFALITLTDLYKKLNETVKSNAMNRDEDNLEQVEMWF